MVVVFFGGMFRLEQGSCVLWRASRQIIQTYVTALSCFVNEAWTTTTDDQFKMEQIMTRRAECAQTTNGNLEI